LKLQNGFEIELLNDFQFDLELNFNLYSITVIEPKISNTC